MTVKKKNIPLNIRQKTILASCFAVLLLFFIGYALGCVIGKNTISKLYNLRYSAVSLIFTPATSYYETSLLINSESETARISGYYSLLDSFVLPDASYLRECYIKENSLSAKKVLIWIFTRLEDRKGALNALEELYKTVDVKEQIYIKRAMDFLEPEAAEKQTDFQDDTIKE